MRSFKTHSLLTIFPERPETCLLRHDQLVRMIRGQTNGRPVGTSWPPNTFGTCCGSGHARRQKAEVNVSASPLRGCVPHSTVVSYPFRHQTPVVIVDTQGTLCWTVSVEGWKLLRPAQSCYSMLFPKRYQWISGWWSGTCFFFIYWK